MKSASHALRLAPLCCLLAALAGCSTREPLAGHRLRIAVQSDEGVPIAGAGISIAGQLMGNSDIEGELAVVLRQPEGTRIELKADCPAGYAGGEPRTITLRSVSSLAARTDRPVVRERLSCNPTRRELVLLISSEGQPDLPVVVDGVPEGQTNEQGFAHTLLSGKPGTSFQVTLDTSANPRLRPQNPTRSFTLDDEDTLLAFVQAFQTTPATGRGRHKVPNGPPRPYRIE